MQMMQLHLHEILLIALSPVLFSNERRSGWHLNSLLLCLHLHQCLLLSLHGRMATLGRTSGHLCFLCFHCLFRRHFHVFDAIGKKRCVIIVQKPLSI